MAKKAIKKENIPETVNCVNCKHAGEVENFMCYCSVYKVKRATGLRKCTNYK